MAVNERTIGQHLYLAKIDTNVRFCPSPHWVTIIEMHEPWRRGRAVTLPAFWPFKTFLVGLWKRTIYEDIEEDFKDDLWLNPHWLDSVSTNEISEWDDLSEPAEEEEDSL